MITWEEKVAWVGFVVKDVIVKSPLRYNKCSVRLSYNPERYSFRKGDTREKAI
jgi:hypothetical protein